MEVRVGEPKLIVAADALEALVLAVALGVLVDQRMAALAPGGAEDVLAVGVAAVDVKLALRVLRAILLRELFAARGGVPGGPDVHALLIGDLTEHLQRVEAVLRG